MKTITTTDTNDIDLKINEIDTDFLEDQDYIKESVNFEEMEDRIYEMHRKR